MPVSKPSVKIGNVGFGVVTDARLLGGDRFPTASRATTWYW